MLLENLTVSWDLGTLVWMLEVPVDNPVGLEFSSHQKYAQNNILKLNGPGVAGLVFLHPVGPHPIFVLTRYLWVGHTMI